jgi:dihydroflavonol-4-reductase
VLAAERGAPGSRYVVSGAALRVTEALGLLADVADVQVRARLIPRSVIQLVVLPLSHLARFVPTKTRICPDLVRVLLHGHTYDGSKATAELGLEYTPIWETLRKTVEWYRAEGLI